MTKAAQVLAELKAELPDMPYYDDSNLEILWSEYGQESETTETGDASRWYTYKTTIWGFDDGSYLAIEWNSGNTEMQESEGPIDMYLVEPYQVTVTKYRKINAT